MKKILYIISLLLIAGVSSCVSEKIPVEFGIDKTEIPMGPEGGSETIHLEAEGKWIANADKPWVVVAPTNGIGTIDCEVKVDTTVLSGDSREAIVRFIDESGKSKDVKVTQLGYGNMIVVDKPEVLVPKYDEYKKRYFEVNVTANVPFDVQIPGEAFWLTSKKFDFTLDRGARPRTVKIRFDWEPNNRPQERTARVEFTPGTSLELARHDALNVVQEQADEIPDSREGDSLAIIGAARSLGCSIAKYEGENLRNWEILEIWEEDDEGFTEDCRGRVKSLAFSFFNTKDGIPYEIQFLSKLENLVLFSNGNHFLYRFHSGEYLAKLERLKSLQCFALGLAYLDDDFKNLKNLETLILGANNFDEIPSILTPQNFPKLKKLDFAGCRNTIVNDLANTTADLSDLCGLYKHKDNATFPRWLFEWDNLEYLRLSYNYIGGEIPDMKDYPKKWTDEDIVASKDTLRSARPDVFNLVGTPKVLPNAKYFAINLNMLTGEIPDWILYHPHLMEWTPDLLVFPQETEVMGWDGKLPGFTNVPQSPTYYYNVYPLKKPDYYEDEE